jgi:hypothetical protein
MRDGIKVFHSTKSFARWCLPGTLARSMQDSMREWVVFLQDNKHVSTQSWLILNSPLVALSIGAIRCVNMGVPEVSSIRSTTLRIRLPIATLSISFLGITLRLNTTGEHTTVLALRTPMRTRAFLSVMPHLRRRSLQGSHAENIESVIV